jgi:hypothetical protein
MKLSGATFAHNVLFVLTVNIEVSTQQRRLLESYIRILMRS